MSNSRTEKLIEAVLNGESLENFKPQSRIEAILKNCCMRCGCDGLTEPRSRNEALLYRLAEELAGGGGGGVDKSVLHSLIDRSITEFNDDTITEIGTYAFAYSKLKTLDVPNIITIKDSAFYQSTSLKSINMPKLQALESGAFYGCYGLSYVDLAILTSIPPRCFGYSYALETLILRAPEVCVLEDISALSNTCIASYSAPFGYIYVPASLLEEYKADETWSYYTNLGGIDRIRAIEDYPEITGG